MTAGQPESASAMKLTRTNCKPERMFAEIVEPDGKSHCEVAHSEVEPVKASEENLYVGCFKLLPFTNRDPRSCTLMRIRTHRLSPSKGSTSRSAV